ncbi:MAG: hypothetical protein PF549_03150 [Patescibacteria group bacterium]|jgi:hypothetical protein|nr:hypothetical protein [Patescibacteria group bacterium]
MKEIVPKDSRYVPFAQQKSCCVPTSILIVMYKLGIPLIPQELLGYHLGLIVDDEGGEFFWNPRIGEKPPAGFGTQIHEEQYKPDVAFEKLGIPLKMIIHPVDDLKDKKDFVEFIESCILEDRDLLACFNHGTLKGDGTSNGHTCVVDRIYPEKNIIRLIDSSPNQPKWRELTIDQLKEAMEKHPISKGGFWELKKNK